MGDGGVCGVPDGWQQYAPASVHFCAEKAAIVTELHDVSLLLLAAPYVMKCAELYLLTAVRELSKMLAVIRHPHICGDRRELRHVSAGSAKTLRVSLEWSR